MKEVIKKKGKNSIILSSIFLAIITLFIAVMITNDKEVSNLFKGNCEVHNIEDLKYCYNENQYVRVYYDELYTTDYGYYIDDVLQAYYLDLDLEGYSLLAVVDKSTGDNLIDNKKNYLDAVITYFGEHEEHNQALAAIKKDYLESFGEGYTEEDIENLIVPFQLNAYDNIKTDNIATLSIFSVVWIIIAIFLINGILKTKNPDKYGSFAKVENKDLLEQEYNNNIIYKTKKVCVTPNYIIKTSFGNVTIKETKKLIWIYKHIHKVSFIPVMSEYVFRFLDGSSISLEWSNEQILSYFPNRLMGYTSQNIQEYNKLVKQYKESIR